MVNFFAVLFPEVVIFTGLIGIFLFGLFCPREHKKRTAAICTIVLFIITTICCFYSLDGSHKYLANFLYKDNFTTSLIIISMLAGSACLFFEITDTTENRSDNFEYPVFCGLAVLGLALTASAADLFVLYLGAELASISICCLLVCHDKASIALGLGLKFFIISFFASLMLLYGIAVVYGFSGTTSLEALSIIFAREKQLATGQTLGVIFILCGLLLKIGIAPFHIWLAKTDEGSVSFSALLLILSCGVILLCVTFNIMTSTFKPFAPLWSTVIEVFAVFSMFLGGLKSLIRSNLKKFIAYSSLANFGYALTAMVIYSSDSLGNMMFFLIFILLGNIGLCAVIYSLRYNDDICDDISCLKGLGFKAPAHALSLTVLLLTLAGLPPLIGFLSRYEIIITAYQVENWFLIGACLIGNIIVICSYGNIIRTMYFVSSAKSLNIIALPCNLMAKICLVLIVFSTIYPAWIFNFCLQAASNALTP